MHSNERTAGRRVSRALLALAFACASWQAHAGKPYLYYKVGDPAKPVSVIAPASRSYVMMGGGLEVDEAFRWMIKQAGVTRFSGGRFLVIRATGDDAYNQYLLSAPCPYSTCVDGASLGLTSAETLVIPSRDAANHEDVIDYVSRANVLWIAGGDQSDYINFWKGTRLDDALKRLLQRNVPFGGLSAGMAVLGQFDYAGQRASATSTDVLNDPFNKNMTLDPAPLALTGGFIAPPVLASTITDTHLDTRDRMGRLITFVARLVKPYQPPPGSRTLGCPGGVLPVAQARGVGVSIQTALLLEQESNGKVRAQVMANPPDPEAPLEERSAYLVRLTEGATACAPGTPLSIGSGKVEIRKLENGARFNFSDWSTIPLYNNFGIAGGVPTDEMLY